MTVIPIRRETESGLQTRPPIYSLATVTGPFNSPNEASGEIVWEAHWSEVQLPPCKLELREPWSAIRP